MSSYAYYNGKFGKKEEISIPLSDRSIFFADAIYDAAIGSYDRILWENEHIERFLSNAEKIGIKHTLTHKKLSSLLREIAVKSMIKDYFIYFQMSRGLPSRQHSAKNAKANLLITVDPFELNPCLPPMRLITFKDKRYGYCNIKTINLLPSVLSATKADMQGCDEAIFVKGQYVTECSKSNISILSHGRIYTHPAGNRILAGITREHLKSCCKAIGVQFIEKKFTVKEMFDADEIIVTGTGKLCRRVSYINQSKVGGGDLALFNKIRNYLFDEYYSFCQM